MFRNFSKIAFSVLFLVSTTFQSSQAFTWKTCKSKDRNYIHIAGSSTISPLMTSVSEEFSRNQSLKNISTTTPFVESTGTINGFKAFCEGIGSKYPDFVNASLPIRKSDIDDCAKNGIHNIIEIKLGYDGIIFGNIIGNQKIRLSREQIFLAIAEKVPDSKSGKLVPNFYKTWNEIDPKLPKSEILVYGPPLTSGTRNVFADIVLEESCLTKKEFLKAYPEFKSRKEQCHKLRDDKRFVESGENDQLILNNLKNNSHAFGIFGFNFLIANSQTLQAAPIDKISPNFSSIASKKYALSRPLFVYFKKENLDVAPHVKEFINEIINPETIGQNGYLVNHGLIPLSNSELDEVRANILSKL
jgi:phosphate transport system substrate-binding protein